MSELVRDFLRGDTSAFSDIVRVYEKNIYCYLYRLCGNKEDAMDLTQDTFIKVYKSLHSFKISMDFKPWIYRIAHNNYVNFFKSKREFADIDEDISDFKTPENMVIEKDSMKAIDSIIENLPYEYKTVFLLRAIDDLSFKEIGSILKISETNARMRYLRVRKKISELIQGGDIL